MCKLKIHHYFNYKKYLLWNLLLHCISYFVLTGFLFLIGIFIQLHSNAVAKDSSITNMYQGVKFYSLVDNFYDPDEFYDFRQKDSNINYLGSFYNELVSSKKLDFLSVFCQPMLVKSFKGDNHFLYNSQEFLEEHKLKDSNVKSIQLNEAAYKFFDLQISLGNSFEWSSVNYDSKVIPVLLGADYKGIYNISDTISVNYYGTDMKFKVIGFLKDNIFIYYKGDEEFYLDQYIIVPYPPYLKTEKHSDLFFDGILYFAMINGDIVTNVEENSFLDEIKRISDSSGFIEFSVIGIPEFTFKYDTLISIIQENNKLIIITSLLLALFILLIQYGIDKQIMFSRIAYYRNMWLIGKNNIKMVYFRDTCIVYIFATVSALILIKRTLLYMSMRSIVFVALTSLCAFCIVYLCCVRSLKRLIVYHT